MWQKFEGGETNEKKDCFDDSIVGFGFGVGRVPLASPRPSLWPPITIMIQDERAMKFSTIFSQL